MGRIKTEDFIKKAKEIHGNKYDYSKANYTNNRTKVCIICPIHGEFWIRPHNHIDGKQGCPKCGKETARICHKNKYKSFLETAYQKFGDAYSYPNIKDEYENNKSKITIRCNKCEREFVKRANDLLSKNFHGCKNCRHSIKTKIIKRERKNKIDEKTFLKRFRAKFGDSITPFIEEYVNTQKEIHFKCNKCGYIFKRRPHNCLNSNGCPECNNVNNQKYTNEIFTEKANLVHNYKYDYSKVNYISTDVKVCVICHEKDKFGEEHGEFYVTPHAHIGTMKSGCPKCSGKFRKDTDYFIKELKLIHGDKYDYSKVNYISAFKSVELSCPIHGSFRNTPNQLLNGRGCPFCNESHLEREIRQLLDDNKLNYEMQTRFEWLKTEDTNKKMSLDFFLPQYNVAIECQGIQHFSSKRFWNSPINKEKILKRIQNRDELKRKLCEKHNIKLLYYSNLRIDYPYKVYEDKNELLKEIKNENH